MLSIRKKVYLFLFAIFFTFTYNLYGHKVNLFTNQLGNKLEGNAFFADGSPCRNCEIKILDSKDKEILKSKTDEKGKFSFLIPDRLSEIKIHLSAGEGHIVEKRLTLKINSKERGNFSLSQNPKELLPIKQISKDNHEFYKNLEEKISNLEDEVRVLREEVFNMRKEIQKISYRDITGVIGYILGVFAIIYFIKIKNNVRKDAS